MKTYLMGGPFDMQFAEANAVEMRIVPDVPDDGGMMIAAKYTMVEASEKRDPVAGRQHGQAAHRFRGFMVTDFLLVTNILDFTKDYDWPKEIR